MMKHALLPGSWPNKRLLFHDAISEIRASLRSYLASIVTANGLPASIELPAAGSDLDLSAMKGDYIKQIARDAMEELIMSK